jgi:F-type H+-transporting ATPase subunit delta
MAKAPVRLARRYARALFESYQIASVEEVRDALNGVAKLWQGSPILREAILNPATPATARVSIMEDIAAAIRPHDPLFKNFLSLLVGNGRAESLPHTAEAFTTLVDVARRILAVEITSARKIASEEQSALLEQLQRELGAMASISWNVQEDLLAGLTVKAGDKLLDSSVRGALTRIREELRS